MEGMEGMEGVEDIEYMEDVEVRSLFHANENEAQLCFMPAGNVLRSSRQ